MRGCQSLIIWTDCDREGENIGHEIIQVCQSGKGYKNYFRGIVFSFILIQHKSKATYAILFDAQKLIIIFCIKLLNVFII